MKIVKPITIMGLFLSVASFASELSFTTKDNFTIKGNYYQSDSKASRGVLMLHQCNYNRSMYNDIGEQLAQRGINALSIDFRGFGGSANDKFNVAQLSDLPREEQRKQWRILADHWPSDVKLAFDYLKSKVDKGGEIGVIGASCGGSQAITLSENEAISAISFFSSGQRDENIERYTTTMSSKPTLIIAAEEDGQTYTSAQKLFTAATNKNSKMLSYKGGEHGYPLLDSDTNLSKSIVAWFDSQLKQ